MFASFSHQYSAYLILEPSSVRGIPMSMVQPNSTRFLTNVVISFHTKRTEFRVSNSPAAWTSKLDGKYGRGIENMKNEESRGGRGKQNASEWDSDAMIRCRQTQDSLLLAGRNVVDLIGENAHREKQPFDKLNETRCDNTGDISRIIK
jgi:hypothetical protein